MELVKKVRPQYPIDQTNFSGRVEVDFVIQEDGRTSDITVVEDVDAAVRKACVDAISQWKFQSYHDDGKLRKAKTSFTFHAPVDGD